MKFRVECLGTLFYLSVFLCVADVGVCLADEQIQPIIEELERFDSANGFPPNYDDILPLLKEYENILSDSQFMQVALFLEKMQRPPISKSALSSLFKSKMKSIRSIRLEYNTEKKYNTNAVERKGFVFVMDDGKFFSDTTFDDMTNSGLTRIVEAFNGEYVSVVRFFQDELRGVEGGIVPYENLESIVPFEFPLYYSGLLDLEIQKLSGRTPLYIPDFLDGEIGQTGILFQKKERIEGADCVLFQRGVDKYYFDPQKDFSLVMVEECYFTTNENNESVPKPYRTFIMREHVDCGNGIWIPQKIEVIFSAGTQSDGRMLLTISNVSINAPVEETQFTNIFPDGALVSDLVHQLVYTWGDRPSINGLLKETIKSKRVWTFQIISVTLGIIMIIVALIMMYLKRRNAT